MKNQVDHPVADQTQELLYLTHREFSEGVIAAVVDAETGLMVFNVFSPDGDQVPLIRAGIMRDETDTEGLHRYLKHMGLARPNSSMSMVH